MNADRSNREVQTNPSGTGEALTMNALEAAAWATKAVADAQAIALARANSALTVAQVITAAKTRYPAS